MKDEKKPDSNIPPVIHQPPSESWHNSHGVKLIVIVCLVLLGLVPLLLIRGVLAERRMRHREAVANITSTWGGSQTIAGPVLVVPYYRYVKALKDMQVSGRTETRELTEKVLGHAYFLPAELAVMGTLRPERLHRSIYETVVYRASLEISGKFAPPSLADWKVEEKDVLWDEATLLVAITDLRGANQTLWLKWGNESVAMVPGGAAGSLGPVVKARVPGLSAAVDSLSFQFALDINGSEGLWFAPFGKENRVRLTSSYPDPSFRGSFLPAKRKVTADGFEADWEVSHYGRNYPQQWSDQDGDPLRGEALRGSLFGVAVVPAVDSYRYVERSIKYGILFLSLVFAGFFFLEVQWLVRVHPVQYTLVGGALCLFYLALLALSEVMPFGWAYATGAVASTGLIAGYSAFLLQAARRAWLVAVGLGIIYGYMYVILRQQDYALLYGTAALFVVLAAMMYVTRNINWYKPR